MLTKAKKIEACWSVDVETWLVFDFLHDFYTLFMEILAGQTLFGRFTTVSQFLPLYNIGWDSVEPWSFWIDFGNSSRLTGVNFIPLEILRDCIWSLIWFSNLCAEGFSLMAKFSKLCNGQTWFQIGQESCHLCETVEKWDYAVANPKKLYY